MLELIVEQGFRQDISIGAPAIAPVVFPRLHDVIGKVYIVLGGGTDKTGRVNGVAVAAAMLIVSGIAGVTAVIGTVWRVIFRVFLQRIALGQHLIQRTRPCAGIFLKGELIHKCLRVKVVNFDDQRSLEQAAELEDVQCWLIAEPGGRQ